MPQSDRSLRWVRPPQQARSQQTLDRLLDAAEALAAEKGFDDTTVAEVARRAGSSVGAFYTRFKDKDGLLHALYDRYYEQAIATADDALDPARWEGAGIAEIVDAVGDTPVLGAGGIGRGRQMAAAMALGAAGVWCGSVWLTTDEAETHPVVKDKFLAATSSDTIRSRSRTGKHARQLKSAWTEEWENPETPLPLGMPMQMVLTAEAIQRIDRAAHKQGSGAEQLSNYFVGQIVGNMNESKPTARVVFEMIEEFIEATHALAAQLED